jgi:hypothetical protein
MDTTLSEAPNLLSNRPVLTPALIISAGVFFFQGLVRKGQGINGEGGAKREERCRP